MKIHRCRHVWRARHLVGFHLATGRATSVHTERPFCDRCPHYCDHARCGPTTGRTR